MTPQGTGAMGQKLDADEADGELMDLLMFGWEDVGRVWKIQL